MKDRILSAAVSIAATRGLSAMTRFAVARRARCVPGSVSYNFDGMDGLRKAVIAHAIENKVLPIIASAVLTKHPAAKNVPEDLQKRALLAQVAS